MTEAYAMAETIAAKSPLAVMGVKSVNLFVIKLIIETNMMDT